MMLSSHCQVTFSLHPGSRSDATNMFCEAHSNWVRDRFHSFDEGRLVMDQVVLHVHPSANIYLARPKEPGLKWGFPSMGNPQMDGL